MSCVFVPILASYGVLHDPGAVVPEKADILAASLADPLMRTEGIIHRGQKVLEQVKRQSRAAQDFAMSKNSLILVLQKQTRESNDSTASMHSLLSTGYVQEVKESAS